MKRHHVGWLVLLVIMVTVTGFLSKAQGYAEGYAQGVEEGIAHVKQEWCRHGTAQNHETIPGGVCFYGQYYVRKETTYR